ncbi:unnamed protein product [Heterobilharzia americana]|nr:unnamed protein product [Heterobilharzia americana]
MTKVEPIIGDNDDYQEFLKQFTLLNSLSAEFRCVCSVIGTELDCTLVRTNLVNLQKRMLNKLQKNQYHLMKCWHSANTDQLFVTFTTLIEYHMRALLKTLHLLTLFPTITQNEHRSNKDGYSNEGLKHHVTKQMHEVSSWVLSNNTLLKMNIDSLIMTGFSKPLTLELDEIQLGNNSDNGDIDDAGVVETFHSNLSEIDVLKNEYHILQKALNDISSLICVTPWNVLAFPAGIEQRLSLIDSTSTVHPPKVECDSISYGPSTEYITMFKKLSNVSTSIGQSRIHLVSSNKELSTINNIFRKVKKYFERRKVFAFLLIGAFIISALIILLILFVVIFPKMTNA